MSAEQPVQGEEVHAEIDELSSTYVPPPPKTIGELVAADQEDESLRKYKETLLGSAISENIVIGNLSHIPLQWHVSNKFCYPEPNNPKRVLVKKLVLVSEGQPERALDLSGDLSQLKQTVFTIKEGVQYRIRIEFYVQHEIVTGLKYLQKTYRKGIQGDIFNKLISFYLFMQWFCCS